MNIERILTPLCTKQPALAISFLLCAGLGHDALAANWIAIQGMEPANAAPLRLFGFTQGTYEQLVNTGDGQSSESSFNIRRARLGARGAIADGRVNYLFLTEFGNNAITRQDSAVLVDASVTFNLLPGLRLRAGQFKQPTMDEALEGNPFASDFINFSLIAAQLAQENKIIFDPNTGVNRFDGGVNAFRDVGVQAFDVFRQDAMEYTYALMLSNGRFGGTDDNDDKDLTGRLQASYVFKGALNSALREELSAFVWHSEGRRDYNAQDYRRMRQGLGVHYNRAPWRFRAEYVRAEGMIETGLTPQIEGGTPTLAPTGEAEGWYAMGSYSLTRNWELNLRYDTLDRLTNQGASERDFSTWTLGGQYIFSPQARVMLNYEIRDVSAPQGGNAPALPERVSAQAVLTF